MSDVAVVLALLAATAAFGVWVAVSERRFQKRRRAAEWPEIERRRKANEARFRAMHGTEETP